MPGRRAIWVGQASGRCRGRVPDPDITGLTRRKECKFVRYLLIEGRQSDSPVSGPCGRETGGILGPMDVPGGNWMVQCADPQGAVFALVGHNGIGFFERAPPRQEAGPIQAAGTHPMVVIAARSR